MPERLLEAASLRKRFLAAGCDFALALLLGFLLLSTVGDWAATRAAQLFRVGEPDSAWQGPVPLMLGAIGNLMYALPLTLLLVLVPEALWGGAAGKSLTGLRVVSMPPANTHRLRIRFLIKCAPCLAWALALALAQPWTISVFVLSCLVIVLGSLPLLRHSIALHDRLARTQVQPIRPHNM